MELRSQEQLDACFEELVGRLTSYRPEADVDLLRRAYAFAGDVHRTQFRQNGDPYISHPLMACHLLADIEADEITLAACMLHDTVEDCAQDEEREVKALRRQLDDLRERGKTAGVDKLVAEIAAREHVIEKLKEEVRRGLEEEFGRVISELVAGVTRLSEVRFLEISGLRPASSIGADESRQEELRRRLQAENLRRMVLAAARDLRVLIIKLADRLHNMQTLYAKRRPKQIKIAQETEAIYAKLAERLGIWRFKWELEDLAFRYLHPREFFEIERRVALTREQRMADIEEVVAQIQRVLTASSLSATVYGRPKHLYSIWMKMQRDQIDFDDIYDLEGIRIITDEVWQCFLVLYRVHELWPHQPEQLADYITCPKPNGYQSLHTKVIVPGHGLMEIQIRTWEMHRQAEYGVAAHWRYKEGGTVDETFASRLSSLRQIFELARTTEPVSATPGAGEEGVPDFQEDVAATLWDDEIYVYTPNGEVIDLPVGATVVDFAYRIHTEVGHTCIGAKVNHRIVPLSHRLKTGDRVEILCQRNTGPSRDWLSFVVTATARNRIRQYFRRKERQTLIQRGQQAIEEEAARLRCDLNDIYRRDRELPAQYRRRGPEHPVEDVLTRIARKRGYVTEDDLLTAVGDGVVSAEGVVRQLMADIEEASEAAGIPPVPRPETVEGDQAQRQREAGVSLNGASNLMIRRSGCCLPIPGDTIAGYVTRGSGIAIHRSDCPNLRHLRDREPERIVLLDWDQTQHLLYDVPVEIRATNRLGLLADVTKLVAELGINIVSVSSSSGRLQSAEGGQVVSIQLRLELVNRRQLENLAERLPREAGAVRVTVRGQVFVDLEKASRSRRRGVTRGGRRRT